MMARIQWPAYESTVVEDPYSVYVYPNSTIYYHSLMYNHISAMDQYVSLPSDQHRWRFQSHCERMVLFVHAVRHSLPYDIVRFICQLSGLAIVPAPIAVTPTLEWGNGFFSSL